MPRSKVFFYDGVHKKTINDSWDFVDAVSEMPAGEAGELYARVAAAFTAVNKSARAVAYMPFALVKGKTDYDSSASWENKVGFLPRPRDLFRRVRQSLIMNNRAYLRMGKNVAGIPKALHFVVPSSIEPITDSATGELVRLERRVNGQIAQVFEPDSPDLVRFWWLDEKTELLPNDQTEFRAIMNSAGILFYSDYFVRNYYKRGGIKPTLIAMKGLISQDKQEDVQKNWTNFIKGIGRAFGNMTKIFNAEAMDIKPFGDGLGDLKETPVYKQAIENIAMGMGMPLSLLLSNSANYATAEVEQSQWFENVVTWCDFIAECLNEQLFSDMGLRLEFRPEVNTEQEDESQRVGSLSAFADALTKFPNAETFLGAATTFGFELSEDLVAAVKKYYADKEANAQAIREQMQKPKEPPDNPPQEPVPQAQPDQPKTATLSLDVLKELSIWCDVAERQLKNGKALDFPYQSHHVEIPVVVKSFIADRLPAARNASDIREVFRSAEQVAAEPVGDNGAYVLAQAINRLADATVK